MRGKAEDEDGFVVSFSYKRLMSQLHACRLVVWGLRPPGNAKANGHTTHHLEMQLTTWECNSPSGIATHHLGKLLTTWECSSPHGKATHHMGVQLTTWESYSPHGKASHHMRMLPTTWEYYSQ